MAIDNLPAGRQVENEERRMKSVLFFIVFGFSIKVSLAQSPSLKTQVDKKQIVIGEQLKYNVEASFPANTYRVSWFNVPDSFSHFEVVIRGKIDTVEKNGVITCRQTLTLTSFDSGRYAIPAMAISFEPIVNDSTINVFTDSIPVNISYSPFDSTQTFHDIKTIIEVKDEIPWWMWAGGTALLIVLVLCTIYLVRYLRARKKKAPLFNSNLSPLDEAMQALGALQNEQLLYKGDARQFHTRLTDIFKRYVSRKMEKNVLNLTSSEMLLLLQDTLLSKTDTALIAGALRMADAVKFAKFFPHEEDSESAWISTRKVIEQFDKLIFTDQNLEPAN